jgi:hypothetical protein
MTDDLAVRDFGSQALAVRVSEAIEKVLMEGDLSGLTSEQRVEYYNATCNSLGLNPLTRPFEYVVLNDKLTLYPRKDCTEQLRKINHISINIIERRVENGVYLVIAEATTPDGRRDEASGAVAIEKEGGDWKKSSSNKNYFQGNGQWSQIRGEALANLYMKAETKAKRRVTLSICGLGMTDESELESIPGVQVVEDGTHYAATKYICQKCKAEIATSEKGASPAEVAAFTSEKLGKQLCAVCAKEEMEVRKKAREATEEERERIERATKEDFPVIHEEAPAKGSSAKALTSARVRFNQTAAYATQLGIKAPEHKASHTASQLESMIRTLVDAIIDAINSVVLMLPEIPSSAIPGDKATLEEWMAFVAAFDLLEVIKEEIAGAELEDESEELEEEAVS